MVKNHNLDDDKVLARLSGDDAVRMLKAIEDDVCLRFHLVQQENDDHDPVIEIIKD
jgi:hypothetical protein